MTAALGRRPVSSPRCTVALEVVWAFGGGSWSCGGAEAAPSCALHIPAAACKRAAPSP